MRDLASQNFGSTSTTRQKSKLIKVVLVVLVVVTLIYFAKTFVSSETSGGSASVRLAEAPRGLTPVDVGETGKITEGGVDLKTENATLSLVKTLDIAAKASASRSSGGGNYILSVDATLPDPGANKYGVWLIDDNTPILIDYMNGSKNAWNLRIRDDSSKYVGLDEVWITLERTKDEKVEEHVFEGSF